MTSDAPNLDILVANLAKQAEALTTTVEMKVSNEPVETDTAVREMLQRIGELVKGASVLGKQRNPVALGVLLRTALENLILLIWVQIKPENAALLKESARAEFTRIALINLQKGKARIMNKNTGEDATSDFLKSDRFQNLKKRVSVETRAKEAGVEDLYTVFYRFMSLEMHGLELNRKNESPETLSIIQMQAMGALALASGHIGAKWLLYRQQTDNETLRELLGIENRGSNGPLQAASDK